MVGSGRAENSIEQERRARQPTGLLASLVWWLVALAPIILAVLGWSPEGNHNLPQALSLTFSLPITAIEFIVIGFAVLKGHSPLSVLQEMPIWSRVVLGLLVAIALGTATFVAPETLKALIRTYAWGVHLLFGLSVYKLLQNIWAPRSDQLWATIVLGAVLYVLLLAVFVLCIPDERAFDWKHLRFGVTHVRQVGFYSIVGVGAALGIAAVESRTLRYWAAISAAALLFALSFWSGTRGSVFAIFAAFGAGLLFTPHIRRWRAAAALAASAMAGALISLVHLPPHSFYGILRISRATNVTDPDTISSGRLTQWEDSARAILERPWFGFGESQYGAAVPAWAEFNHPHNIFLQLLLQWGIVGTVCFLALAGLLAWRILEAVRKGPPSLLPAFLVGVGLAVMSLYEGSLYHPYPVAMIALAAAFIMARRHELTTEVGAG